MQENTFYRPFWTFLFLFFYQGDRDRSFREIATPLVPF